MEKNTMNKKIILIIIGIVLVVIAVGVWLSSQEEQISCNNNLDCSAQMECEDSICVDVGCVEEGGMIPGAISPEHRERIATECCAGLKGINYFKNYDADCNPAPLAGGPAGVCSDCGNGACEEWENKCNCAEDCSQEVCRDENYTCTVENIPCCAGLKEVGRCGAQSDSDLCLCANCGSICRPCGNGICDENENICSCPEDCDKTNKAPYVKGELIVGFNSDVTEDEAEKIVSSYGLSIKEFHNNVLIWAVVNVPKGEEQNWIDVLENDIVIDYAELNRVLTPHN